MSRSVPAGARPHDTGKEGTPHGHDEPGPRRAGRSRRVPGHAVVATVGGRVAVQRLASARRDRTPAELRRARHSRPGRAVRSSCSRCSRNICGRAGCPPGSAAASACSTVSSTTKTSAVPSVNRARCPLSGFARLSTSPASPHPSRRSGGPEDRASSPPTSVGVLAADPSCRALARRCLWPWPVAVASWRRRRARTRRATHARPAHRRVRACRARSQCLAGNGTVRHTDPMAERASGKRVIAPGNVGGACDAERARDQGGER